MAERKQKKSEANRAYYRKAKARQEAALLRLDLGDLARLDQACAAVGLSRSAFAKLYLLPMAEAIAAHLREVESARVARGISLATFIDRAVANALATEPTALAAPTTAAAADEFDALFGSSDGGM